MLNLTLRPEFRGKTLKGTVIELRDSKKGGAIERPADQFLDITYPSIDLLRMVEALQPDKTKTVVLKGGRGQGKSHMLATAFHLLRNHAAASKWRDYWAARLGDAVVGKFTFRQGFHVIAEAMHNQRYKHLWDLLWDQHPHGQFVKGQWTARGTNIPSNEDVLTLVTHTPTVLILDEFQTWFDGLTNTKQYPHRTWAFNFIQTLSEVARAHPDKLALVLSVRDGSTDAYQQVHRVDPEVVDFTGPLVKRDRRRLLLYRIFENRFNIPDSEIAECLDVHFRESCRIRQVPAPEVEKERGEFVEAWPFSPKLLQLLDDQVLMATEAQETRDLIKLLVETFKVAGDGSPVLTAADFRIDNDKSAVGSLIDSVANQVHRDLRERALRNLQNVNETVDMPAQDVPHAAEVISALWLRSLTVDRLTGAHPSDLLIDITRTKPIDENAFRVELSRIREGSFNLHEIGGRLVFKNEENNETKLLANARNNKLFADGKDVEFLAKLLHSVLAGADTSPFRILVLRRNWENDPWTELPPESHPQAWDNRIPLIVLPEFPNNKSATLGRWVAKHLASKRNTVRFLLPTEGTPDIYVDSDIIIDARAAKLAMEWKITDKEFGPLQIKFEREVTAKLKGRFPVFAILDIWDFATSTNCQFAFDKHDKQGAQIPQAIHTTIKEAHFIPEEFEALVATFAKQNASLADLLKELQEPLSGGQHSIPWLGEADTKDNLEHLVARGLIALNLRGSTWIQANAGESETDALPRIRGKLSNITGTHLASTTLHLPSATPSTGGVTPAVNEGGNTAGELGTPPAPGGLHPGALFGGNTPFPPPADGSGGGAPAPGGGGGITSTVPRPSAPVLTSPANSPLNLLGTVEQWGITGQTKMRTLRLSTEGLTGAQLQLLLRKLPDGKYVLEVQKEEGL
jgi:hypothetical protein